MIVVGAPHSYPDGCVPGAWDPAVRCDPSKEASAKTWRGQAFLHKHWGHNPKVAPYPVYEPFTSGYFETSALVSESFPKCNEERYEWGAPRFCVAAPLRALPRRAPAPSPRRRGSILWWRSVQ